METLSRALLALSLLAIGVIVMALVLPDIGGVGPPPSPDAAIATVTTAATQPIVLFALMLAALLALASTATPGSRPMSATVSPRLPPLPATASTPTRLVLTREAITRAVTPATSGEQVLDVLLEGAARCGASDVHVQPGGEGGQITFRVDGQLEPVLEVSHVTLQSLINRLKVVARLVHYKSDAPQDGGFSHPMSDGQVDVRLSLLPTQHGEKAVLRLTGLGRRVPTLDDLGLTRAEHEQLERLLQKPQGLLFFTGPTGSGKSTSIYGALQHLRAVRGGNAQIASIEDPIELTLPHAAQTQVNRSTGLDFASGLRAILRQDPNIIVVGEIRDAETAGIAVQAGLTGHLILTTVHADSAAGVFNRLLEMGVEPAILASVSLAAISQRLVRKLCPHCRASQAPSDEHAKRLLLAGLTGRAFFTSKGCEQCGGAGYIGRAAIFEVLEMSTALRDALSATPNTQALMALAVKNGTVPLLTAAVARAAEGVTTLDEAFRVAG
ncbi:MAG: GspE/PulE family protein [Myxococcales bacterium]|nr:GspE/PulE family protein [Myxococcales bacterium]